MTAPSATPASDEAVGDASALVKFAERVIAGPAAGCGCLSVCRCREPAAERLWIEAIQDEAEAALSARTAAPAEQVVVGASRVFGYEDDNPDSGEWYREITVGGVMFLAPLDKQDEARHILARLTPIAPDARSVEAGAIRAVIDDMRVTDRETVHVAVVEGWISRLMAATGYWGTK